MPSKHIGLSVDLESPAFVALAQKYPGISIQRAIVAYINEAYARGQLGAVAVVLSPAERQQLENRVFRKPTPKSERVELPRLPPDEPPAPLPVEEEKGPGGQLFDFLDEEA
jgi:hypothetical protein